MCAIYQLGSRKNDTWSWGVWSWLVHITNNVTHNVEIGIACLKIQNIGDNKCNEKDDSVDNDENDDNDDNDDNDGNDNNDNNDEDGDNDNHDTDDTDDNNNEERRWWRLCSLKPSLRSPTDAATGSL